MYKDLVQQKVQNNYVTLLIKQFVFTKLVESLYTNLETHLRMEIFFL